MLQCRITSAVRESIVTTALLGLLTALRHRAKSVLDKEQKPYSDDSDTTLLLYAQMSADIVECYVHSPLYHLSNITHGNNNKHQLRFTLIAESVESALMQYTNCWKSAIRQFTVTE